MRYASARSVVVWVLLLAFFSGDQGRESVAEPTTPPVSSKAQEEFSPAEAAIREALDKPYEINVAEKPLREVLAGMAKKTGINIHLDRRGLRDLGIAEDAPVTLQVKGVRLRSVLRRMLVQVNLSFGIRDDALVVSNFEELGSKIVTEVYPVADLIGDPIGSDKQAARHTLVDLIQSSVAPATWSAVGGPGGIAIFKEALVVSCGEEVHEEIEYLLSTLRLAKASYEKWNGRDRPIPHLPASGYWDARELVEPSWKPNLSKPISVDFKEIPLAEVVVKLKELTETPLVIDTKALKDVGIELATPVTFSCRNMPLSSALRHMLKELDLNYVFRDEVLLITTPEECNSKLVLVVVPVFDLAAPSTSLDLAEAKGQETGSVKELIHVMTTSISPATWEVVGGPGSIEYYAPYGSLVVVQTPETIEELTPFLDRLRKTVPVAPKPDAAALAREVITQKHGPFDSTAPAGMVARTGAQEPIGGPACAMERVDVAKLAEAIKVFIEPESWQGAEAGPRIFVFPDRLLIRHTRATQAKIERFIAGALSAKANSDLGTGHGWGGP